MHEIQGAYSKRYSLLLSAGSSHSRPHNNHKSIVTEENNRTTLNTKENLHSSNQKSITASHIHTRLRSLSSNHNGKQNYSDKSINLITKKKSHALVKSTLLENKSVSNQNTLSSHQLAQHPNHHQYGVCTANNSRYSTRRQTAIGQEFILRSDTKLSQLLSDKSAHHQHLVSKMTIGDEESSTRGQPPAVEKLYEQLMKHLHSSINNISNSNSNSRVPGLSKASLTQQNNLRQTPQPRAKQGNTPINSPTPTSKIHHTANNSNTKNTGKPGNGSHHKSTSAISSISETVKPREQDMMQLYQRVRSILQGYQTRENEWRKQKQNYEKKIALLVNQLAKGSHPR